MEGMESLERALKATRLLFEENSAGDRHEATMNSRSEKLRRALNCVLNTPKVNLRSGDLLYLVRDLKDATNDISVCQRNNQHAFKFVWYHHMAKEQWNVLSSLDVRLISNVEGRVWKALDSVLDAFRFRPFAVSPEQTNRLCNLPTFAILTHNQEAAVRHGELARQIGKACVDDHVRRYGLLLRELYVPQNSLFELLWSGTVRQLKQHSLHSSDDPERPEFERVVEKLDRVLQGAIVHLKKQQFTIASCGTVEADKSLFLNALMGRLILPSYGEPVHSLIPTLYSELMQSGFPQPGRAVFAMSKARLSLNYDFMPNNSSPR